ncbi:MAG: RNA polymerase sigma-70 factor [Balneolaceae bacterium]|nr:MAG: RNA polymerase sigma-70 factor [Balneolaceae bacterium]
MKTSSVNKTCLTDAPGNIQEVSEDTLLQRIRIESHKESFELLFRTYYQELHVYAYSYLKEKEAAEDVIQTVFMRIWSKREEWNPGGTIQSYLFQAVKNESLNALRKRRFLTEHRENILTVFRENSSAETATEPGTDSELQKQIEIAIDNLPDRCRQIFLLNRRSGLTYREIAEHLDISLNTVNTQMGRALYTLRNHLVRYLSAYVAATSVATFF